MQNAVFAPSIHRRLAAVMILGVAVGTAQQQGPQQRRQPIEVSRPPLGDGPFLFDTAEQHQIRVSVLSKGLSHPGAWHFFRMETCS